MRLHACTTFSTASKRHSIACKTITTNAAFLHRVDQHLRCVSTHNVRACCILHPTPPSRVGKQWEMNEPPKPLRRVNINHTNTRSGMQLRSHCFVSLQPWYLGQFKPRCIHDCPQVKEVIPRAARRCHGCVRHVKSQLQVKRPKWHTHPGNLVPWG